MSDGDTWSGGSRLTGGDEGREEVMRVERGEMDGVGLHAGAPAILFSFPRETLDERLAPASRREATVRRSENKEGAVL